VAAGTYVCCKCGISENVFLPHYGWFSQIRSDTYTWCRKLAGRTAPLVLETGHKGHHETSFSAVDVKATMPSFTQNQLLIFALTKLCKDNASYYAIVGSIIFA
jgi:hypothetical protein